MAQKKNSYFRLARVLLVAMIAQALLGFVGSASASSAQLVSMNDSSVFMQQNSASVGEMAPVNVKLLDQNRQPVFGHQVQLFSNQAGVSVYTANATTNNQGIAQFMVLGEQEGIYEFVAYDQTANIAIGKGVKLAIFAGSNTPIALASESGPLDGFRIEGIGSEVLIGDTLNMTLTAIDSEGNTVTDYTGTVRFSSSDVNASLPNDYSFRAEDAGKHVFSLGVKFLTTGPQSLTVTDLEQFTISSTNSFNVSLSGSGSGASSSQSSSSSVEAGDFKLISPSSGSLSSNDLSVQGQGTYGETAVIYINEEEAARADVEFDDERFSTTIENLEDGTYDVYVELVELGDGEPGQEEILQVNEISEIETVLIDTQAPELIEVSIEGAALAGELVEVQVLSEADLEEAYVLFDEELYPLEATSTSGKYSAELPLGDAGQYSLDVILMDTLGNEVEYRDATTFTVEGESTETESGEEVEGEEEDSEPKAASSSKPTEALTARSDEERVILSWELPQSVNQIAYYRVYYGPAPEALFAISDTLDASTSWVVEDLEGDQIYYFAVAAVDIEGQEGPRSESVLAVPLSRSGAAPAQTYVPVNPEIRPTGMSANLYEVNQYEPPRTPDSGAGTWTLLALSGLGGAAHLFVSRRKKSYTSS